MLDLHVLDELNFVWCLTYFEISNFHIFSIFVLDKIENIGVDKNVSFY